MIRLIPAFLALSRTASIAASSPDRVQRNPGATSSRPILDFAPLHPGYKSVLYAAPAEFCAIPVKIADSPHGLPDQVRQ